jgi:UDP-glucose 4-epimerase
MTVLVTGGAGYIGSHTVHALNDAGERLVVLDNLSTGFASALPKGMLPVVGDIGDKALIASLIETHRVDAIIHFAGSTIVPESIRDPLLYYRNNTANSRILIEAAVQGGVRHFIFSSTAAVYGNPVRVPVAEDDPTEPLSPYGWSKLMTEQILRDARAAHGLGHVVLRYFNVAGADPQMRTGLSTAGATHLIKVAVEAALGRRPAIDVYGTDYPTPDGTCIRDFIHVSDLARASRRAHLSAQRRRRDHTQLRLRPRLLGAGRARGGAPRGRRQAQGEYGGPPRWRHRHLGRQDRSYSLGACLDAGTRRPRQNRRPRARLGAAFAPPRQRY